MVKMCYEGGGVQKTAKNQVTSFMDGPLGPRLRGNPGLYLLICFCATRHYDYD